MSESYEGRQVVGIDLHRRRSVIVRMTAEGEPLEAVRITNGVEALREVMSRAGEAPETVLEATYGWYWAADALAGLGAQVHLAHPLGVKAFEYRRVKNDFLDAADLADLLRMGRLPHAWIAPPATRELRELVRHRAKLVAMGTSLKCRIHAVLASHGVNVPMSDLFGVAGRELLDRLDLPGGFGQKVASCRRLLEAVEMEEALFAGDIRSRLNRDPGFKACRTLPGVGPVLASVFVAEIGEVHRFRDAPALACWAGLTPKHHESDRTVRRGHITKQGSRLVRWAAVEAVQRVPAHTRLGQTRDRVAERRGGGIGKVAAARLLLEYVYYALRDGKVRALSAPARTAGAA